MDQNLDKPKSLNNKLILFYNSNKSKIFSAIIIILILAVSLIFLERNNLKKNEQIAEKYVKATLYLSSEKKSEAIKLFDEIIISKNVFYSILSLNTIVEKNLNVKNDRILEYFEIVEKKVKTDEQKDLIIFKKALYQIKQGNVENGKTLLKNLINKNSKLKSFAKEIISN